MSLMALVILLMAAFILLKKRALKAEKTLFASD
jgi:hypothetical protein